MDILRGHPRIVPCLDRKPTGQQQEAHFSGLLCVGMLAGTIIQNIVARPYLSLISSPTSMSMVAAEFSRMLKRVHSAKVTPVAAHEAEPFGWLPTSDESIDDS